MIDPQTQANKFVKNISNTANGFEVLKLSDNNLIRGIEMAI